jgi:ankyrin repeat protein
LAEIDLFLETREFSIPTEPSRRIGSTTIVPNSDSQDTENEIIKLVAENQIDLLKEFLDKKIHIIASNEEHDLSSSIFLRVCSDGSLDSLKALVARLTINFNYSDDLSGRTCLHEAAIMGRVDLLSCNILYLFSILFLAQFFG